MHSRPSYRLSAGSAATLAAAAMLLALPAFATSDTESLRDEARRIGGQLAETRVELAEAGRSGQMPPTIAAHFEVRISDLEAQVRSLTGRIEELDYGVRQANERLDKAMGDIDFRLGALEGAKGEGGKSATGGAARRPAEGGPANAGIAAAKSGPAPSGATGGEAAREMAAAHTGATLPAGTEIEQYQYSIGLLRKGEYEQAAGALKAFVAAHPKGPLAGNAVYWLGESFYVRGQYDQAAVHFAEGYQKYPTNAKGPDNLLKLGMSLARLNKKAEACASFSELQRKYPSASSNVKNTASAERSKLSCR